jgi:hypothetical protein
VEFQLAFTGKSRVATKPMRSRPSGPQRSLTPGNISSNAGVAGSSAANNSGPKRCTFTLCNRICDGSNSSAPSISIVRSS